jgi:hypothetical protein
MLRARAPLTSRNATPTGPPAARMGRVYGKSGYTSERRYFKAL